LLIGLVSSPVWAAPTEIVSFGDSLSDVGNLYVDSGRTVPSPPYFNGRFSNGPVWVEHLASHLNLSAPAPSLSGGANYAWGGAQTGNGLSFYDTPNLGMQIDSYLGSHTPAGTTLFTLWGGANDLLVDQGDPAPVVANLSGHISIIAAAGGQHFLVGNLPPLGKFPSVLSTPASALLDALTVQFNGLLSSELDKLQSSLGVTIYRLDAYNIYQSIFANPAAYGLTNVTRPAFNDITVVPNPDQYLFWDGDHPTRVVSRLLGDAAAALVPTAAGDFNNDGNVDAADYVVWRDGLGTTYTQNDFNDWRANFGRAPSAGWSAGVPEPSTLVLTVLALLPLACEVRRPARNGEVRS
jgi:phospholipase/lecithinase/hemolysin